MKLWGRLLLLSLVLIQIAATNPDKAKSTPQSARKGVVMGSAGAVGNSIAAFFGAKKTSTKTTALEKGSAKQTAAVKDQSASKKSDGTDEPEMLEVATPAAAAPLPKIVLPPVVAKKTAVISSPVRMPVKAQKIERIPVVPPPIPRVEVMKVRQEVQKIIELNKKIKDVQGGSSIQFQRVQEQARIHQKILAKIEASPEGQTGLASKTPSKEAFLAQEKLRIIHEETQRNAALLEAVDSEKEAASGEDSKSSGSVVPVKKSDATVKQVSGSGQKLQDL